MGQALLARGRRVPGPLGLRGQVLADDEPRRQRVGRQAPGREAARGRDGGRQGEGRGQRRVGRRGRRGRRRLKRERPEKERVDGFERGSFFFLLLLSLEREREGF